MKAEEIEIKTAKRQRDSEGGNEAARLLFFFCAKNSGYYERLSSRTGGHKAAMRALSGSQLPFTNDDAMGAT